jgi:integrase
MEADGRIVEKPTVPQACDAFMADAVTRGLREPTLYKYRLLLGRLKDFANDYGIVFVKDFDIVAVRKFRESWKYRNFSARKRLEELRAFFNFCSDSEWITKNPARKIRMPVANDPPVVPLSEATIEAALAACDSYPNKLNAVRLRALVLLLRHTGISIRDAVTLSRERIEDGKLYVRRAKTGTKVYCPLHPDVIDALAKIPETGPFYFWSGNGLPKSVVADYQRAIARLFKRAGVRGTPHQFRHSFAKGLLMAGVPTERVAALLGHRNPAITAKHYSQWIQERQDQLESDVRRTWQRESDKKVTIITRRAATA